MRKCACRRAGAQRSRIYGSLVEGPSSRVAVSSPRAASLSDVGPFVGLMRRRRGSVLHPVDVDLQRRAVEDGGDVVPRARPYEGGAFDARERTGRQRVRRESSVLEAEQIAVVRRRVVLLDHALLSQRLEPDPGSRVNAPVKLTDGESGTLT